MCWRSKKMNKCISDGKVKVFKVCTLKNDGKLYGYFYKDFQYELNTKYKQDITFAMSCLLKGCFIHYGYDGFHSYSKDVCKAKLSRPQDLWPSWIKVVNVYKNSNHQEIADYVGEYNFNFVIVEGYLPKGTTYYVNDKGEIISDSIILTNTITKP